MRLNFSGIKAFVGYGLLALAIIGIAGLIWGGLITLNTRTTPTVPWVLAAIVALLWIMWRYLDGSWWPKSTSAKRRMLLRANRVSRQAAAWSTVAGLLAIIALAGFWIVMFRVVRMPANPLLPEHFTSSPVLRVAIILGASLVAPISEESGVRGYLQSSLERHFTASTAIVLSSVVFAIAHVTQGLAWPKLVFYFLVGVTFGSLAYLNNSILPVIPVHIAGDLIFFFIIWPHDSSRRLISETGADGWFWLHLAQVLVFATLAFLCFRRLRQVTATEVK